ncbi:MAG: hypothetical protein WDO56_18710 [Gammaproteobacteria bacterium]
MKRLFASCAATALLIALTGCSSGNTSVSAGDAAPTQRSAEDILLGKPYTGPARPTPRGADSKPLLTGYWKLLRESGKPDGNLAKDEPGGTLPYTDKGKSALEYNRTKTIDPEARCLIAGIPRLLTSVLPFEILQTQERLGTFHYLSWHRWVWLDGRKADADPDPHYLGNAIGHWEGDTLVVESTGFKDSADGKFWLDDNGNPQSSKAVVVERWTRPDFHHLTLQLTYTDPVYYAKPVTYSRSWVIAEPGEGRPEFSCEWNTRWIVNHLEPGPGAIDANGNRGFGPGGQIVPDLPLGSVDSAQGNAYWLYRKNKPKPSDLPAK